MKTNIFFIIMVLQLSFVSGQNNVTLSGNIKNSDLKEVRLLKYNSEREEIAKAEVKDGKFEIQAQIDKKNIFQLITDKNKDYVLLILKPGDKITMEADAHQPIISLNFFGSLETRKLVSVIQTTYEYNLEVKKFENIHKNSTDDEEIKKLKTKYRNLMRKRQAYIKSFVKENMNYLAGLFLMNYLDVGTNYELVKEYYNSIYEKNKHIEVVQIFHQKIQQEDMLQPGKDAPPITVKDIHRNKIYLSLSTQKGNYVLLKFCASWCVSCKHSIRYLKADYEKYKDKNFKIFSICIEDHQQDWKNSVQEEHIPWGSGSDLKGWKSPIVTDYNITSLPSLCLIDPEGKIVARSFFYDEIRPIINKIFE